MKSHDVSKDPVSIRPTTGPAGTGHRSEDGRTSPAGPASTYRSREKGREEWGLPPREALRSLARTYLEQQAIHWPVLVGTPAVPRATEAGIDAMASAFEDRFRSLSVERFDAAGVPACWRQIARISRNLEEMEGDVAIRDIIRKVSEMEADLEALRAELVAERRRNQSPPVTRIKEKDVLAELNRLRDVLLSDVGAAASVLKALVGDVVIESRTVEGQSRPEMVARFTINAVPALAA